MPALLWIPRAKAMAAVKFLLNAGALAARPWSAYTFANGYISYGLSRLSSFERIDPSYSSVVVDWLRSHQGACGGFEDTEDTAIAVAALSALLDVHEEGRQAYVEMSRMVPKPPCTIQRCFLGYSGKSTVVALEIKESLMRRLPMLEIKDWRWDFQFGRVLMSEIENVSRECQFAVFLVKIDYPFSGKQKELEMPMWLFSAPRLLGEVRATGFKVKSLHSVHSVTNLVPSVALDEAVPSRKLMRLFGLLSTIEEMVASWPVFRRLGCSLILTAIRR